MEWGQITSDEESDEIEELPLNRLQLMVNSKGCSETIKNLQKAVQIHENRQSVLEEMRERRREASQGSVKSSQSSDWYTDDSAQSVVDVSSQDEDEDASVFIKEENLPSEMEDQESHETEPEMPTPVELPASQRRTSTRTKSRTQRYGIDLVNDEGDEESEEIRRRMGSLRLFENQRQQWHKEESEEFRKQMRDNLRIFADQRRRKEEVQVSGLSSATRGIGDDGGWSGFIWMRW